MVSGSKRVALIEAVNFVSTEMENSHKMNKTNLKVI